MNAFDQGFTSSDFRPCRSSTIRLVENTLIILILGVVAIAAIQHAHVVRSAQHLSADTAQTIAASPKSAYKFVEGKLVKS